MSKIIISNRNTLLLFLIYPFFLSGTIYAQRNETANPGGKGTSVDKTFASPVSDGCTMWFDGDYKDCCVQHDLEYLKGGNNWRTRLRADNMLFICVAGKKGLWHIALAPVMWAGVRIFGSDLSPSSRKNIIHKFFKRTFTLLGNQDRQSRRNVKRPNNGKRQKGIARTRPALL